MQIKSPVFGNIEIADEKVLDFPAGLPGFEHCRRFALVHEEGHDPDVFLLQSLDDAEVAFSVTGPERLGINFAFRQAEPDGETLAWVAPGMSTRPLGPPEQQIDYDGVNVIGGIAIPVIAYARRDVEPGIETAVDIANVHRITVAGFQPRSGFDLNTIIGLELLDVQYDYVAGFAGGSDIMAAMLRGDKKTYQMNPANGDEALRLIAREHARRVRVPVDLAAEIARHVSLSHGTWAEARALGKPLRYSFGRADREYKDRWCNRAPVFQV